MNQFYFLILIFGIISLFYSLKSIFLVRRIEKYNEILEINLPSLDNGKVEILPLFYYKLKEFFNASYDEKNGLKTRGVIVLLVVIAVVCLINALFLNFNQLIFLIIGIYLGAVIGKKLELKALQNEFESTFPQALVILNGAISSGNNVIQALNDASQNVEGVLSREFKTITRSLSIGDDPTNVFAESYRRLPFQNYYFFLTAILVSMKTCSKLKEILSRLSNATTKAKAMERKKLAMTSEARMSSKITAGIPFLFLFLMKFINPLNFEYLMNDPNGRYILYYFLVSELIGMLIVIYLMRKL